MNREPVLTASFLGAFVVALLQLLIVFGVPLTADQMQAIQGFVAVVAPLIVGIIARYWAYSPATVQEERRKSHGH